MGGQDGDHPGVPGVGLIVVLAYHRGKGRRLFLLRNGGAGGYGEAQRRVVLRGDPPGPQALRLIVKLAHLKGLAIALLQRLCYLLLIGKAPLLQKILKNLFLPEPDARRRKAASTRGSSSFQGGAGAGSSGP